MWTWFSRHILRVSVFIVYLYMIHDYFSRKIGLYWRNISEHVIVESNWEKHTGNHQHGTQSYPSWKQFWQHIIFYHLDCHTKITKLSRYVHWDNKHRNACNNWQSRLIVSKYMTTYISGKNVHFGGRGHFTSRRPHNKHNYLRVNINA